MFIASTGAGIGCIQGVAPMPLNAKPSTVILTSPIANITDAAPMTNVPSFVLCANKANPAVAAIIASSLGSVQIGPCIPLPTPWTPLAPHILINGNPILVIGSVKTCYPGGIIAFYWPMEVGDNAT